MNTRLLVITIFLFLMALSCSSQGGEGNSDGDTEEDDYWPFQPDGDEDISHYECNADVDCNNPSYKCEDHFCVPRYLPDGDVDSEAETADSEWPCGVDCSTLPNTFKAHCIDQGYCEIDECWPGYDNCDDQFENGCEQEVYTNMENCGRCLNKCKLVNASEECKEGACIIIACEGEYQNTDGIDSTGCECIDTGSDVFGDGADTDCDGIDGQIENFIFVSEDGLGDGSKENPLGDIQEGIDIAAEGQMVLISKGDYPGPLTLREGISVYGGWDTGFRARAYENEVNVIVDTYLNQEDETLPMNFVGLYAEGIHENTRLEIINFIIEDNISPSGSNIGMWISDCNYRLSFDHVKVEVGAGGNGASGEDGREGGDGLQGQQGQPGCENDSNFFCTDSNCSTPQGGRGGESPCGNEGGIGGIPGLGNDGGQDNSGVQGGEGDGGTPGGAGGLGANNLTDDFECECEGCSNCVWTNGEQGKYGNRGQTGQHGAASDPAGEIIDGMWYATLAGNGGNGECGSGGGGGGGGGGGRCGATHDCKRYGSAGSGGGGGGKGGGGGTGATGGGASIGVFMLAASADMRQSEIISGNGGNGGKGGLGGLGGEGGAGGPEPEFGSNQRAGGCGGAGGDGGAGGNGGDGGGGSGGPSWGFYLLDNSVPNIINTEITHGGGGQGGEGGNYGQVGPSGDTFIEEEEIEEGDGDEEMELESEPEIEFELELEEELVESDGDMDLDSEFEFESELIESEPELEPEPEFEPEPEMDEEDIFSANPDRDRDFDYDKPK